MISILDSQIKLVMDDSILDCHWYYSCLFSPKKKVVMDAVLDDNAGNNSDSKENRHLLHSKDEKSQHGIAEDAKNEKRLREESGSSSHSPCIESSLFGLCNKDEEEGEWLASVFTVLDEDDDGRLTAHEIMRYLLKLGLEMPKEELELVVRSVSACGDEFLTAMEFAEFYRIIFANKEKEADVAVAEEKTICEAFNVFDQNGDGFISAMELADVLSRLGFVEGRDVDCCQSMIESVDFNGDGFVDIDEFKHLISTNASPLHPHFHCVAAIN